MEYMVVWSRYDSPKQDFILEWLHNERDGVSNYPRLNCLHNRLSRCWSKKTSKLRATGLCEGNSPVTGEFPAQRASNAENGPIWWRHHDLTGYQYSNPSNGYRAICPINQHEVRAGINNCIPHKIIIYDYLSMAFSRMNYVNKKVPCSASSLLSSYLYSYHSSGAELVSKYWQQGKCQSHDDVIK